MALKDWKKITKDETEYFHDSWKHLWRNVITGEYFYIQKVGKNYYINSSRFGSILIDAGYRPKDPVKNLEKALKVAEKYMKKN